MRIAIETRHELNQPDLLEQILDFLTSQKKEIFLSEAAKKISGSKFPLIDYSEDFDLLLVLGGDGTVLRSLQNFQICPKLLPVNLGTLGFLAEVTPEEVIGKLEQFFSGEFSLEKRDLLFIELFRDGKKIFSKKALNELVISNKEIARLISVKALVDQKVLTHYRADGLILSTPTGSTAYNLSAGGPLLYPLLPAFILTPICPHSFSQKPIVIPSEKVVSFEIEKIRDEKVVATLDGQVVFDLELGDSLKVKKAESTLDFVRFEGEDFYKVLKKKLGWGTRFKTYP